MEFNAWIMDISQFLTRYSAMFFGGLRNTLILSAIAGVLSVLVGLGNVWGSIIAATLLTLLPELLRAVNSYRMLIYAILLIAMMLFNNSPLKARLLEKRGMKQMAKLEKSEKGGA